MKFPTFIAATILLGLGANAAAVADTDAAMAAGIGGNKHYGVSDTLSSLDTQPE